MTKLVLDMDGLKLESCETDRVATDVGCAGPGNGVGALYETVTCRTNYLCPPTQ